MKFQYCLFLLLLQLFTHAQSGTWTWIKGADTVNSRGNFGTRGVPSSVNEPRGLYSSAFWTDTAGNLWLFGGSTAYGSDESLWKFDLNTMQWTWVNGSSAFDLPPHFAAPSRVFDTANSPGALVNGAMIWVDKQNHLWLYGGFFGGISGSSSNLWQYDPILNKWAWINGGLYNGHALPVYGTRGNGDTANTPGNRVFANAEWTDSAGNFWLFGGFSFDTTGNPGEYINYPRADMWEYNISTGRWIWMSGSSMANDVGFYGPQGVPSVNYYPAARGCNMHWQDSEGNFWLGGGVGIAGNIYYNDVWKFNPTTLEWTWVKGSQFFDTTDIASGNCQINAANQQGGRDDNSVTWRVCDDLIINHGGVNNYNGIMSNDLWGFLPIQNDWVEINEYSLQGSYGTQGVTSLQNYPPARYGSCSFIDRNNNLWLFGGASVDSNSNFYFYNDLWKYTLDTACLGSFYCNNNYTGVTNIPNEETISIYPNPLSIGSWQLSVSNNLIGAQLQIFDANGRIVYKSVIQNTHSEISSQLPGGVYLLRIVSGTNTVTRKLVRL